MSKVLIIYGTQEQQTAKIASTICAHLRDRDIDATVMNIDDLPADFRVQDYDGVIVGASVHVGRHQPAVTAFVERHRATLSARPSAFFSVSLSAAGTDPEQQSDAMRLMREFEESTKWQPDEDATFAGALKYSQYGVFKRFILKMIAKRSGGDTDTSRDYEYTDWDTVAAFANEFADLLQRDALGRTQPSQPSR